MNKEKERDNIAKELGIELDPEENVTEEMVKELTKGKGEDDKDE